MKPSRKWNGSLENGRKHLQIINVTRSYYKELIQLIHKNQNILVKKWAGVTEETFSKTRYTNGTWKGASTSLGIREMQSKLQWDTTSKLLECVIKDKKEITNKCQGCGEKGTLVHCWWEYKLVEIPHDPEILLLDILEGNGKPNLKRVFLFMFATAFFTIARHGNSLNVHWGWITCSTYTKEYSQHCKRNTHYSVYWI